MGQTYQGIYCDELNKIKQEMVQNDAKQDQRFLREAVSANTVVNSSDLLNLCLKYAWVNQI